MLKIGKAGRTASKKIMILKAIRDVKCVHLPELMWVSEENEQLGIMPVGQPINF
jgi:hypothetical protein